MVTMKLLFLDLLGAFHERETLLDQKLLPQKINAIDKFLLLFEPRYTKHRSKNQLFDLLYRFKAEIYESMRLYFRVLDDEFITDPADPRCMLQNNINQAIEKYSSVIAYLVQHDAGYKRKGLKTCNKWEHLELAFKITIASSKDEDDFDGDEEDDYELLGTVPVKEKVEIPATFLGRVKYRVQMFLENRREERKARARRAENMKGKPSMAKSHQQIIKNAINRKRKKKQQREEKQRRKLLENSNHI